MPKRPQDQLEEMHVMILAALKAGMDSPKAVSEWIAQHSEIDPPSIPTIAAAMKRQGYEPAGFKWVKVKGK
jgi:hypothetical protein